MIELGEMGIVFDVDVDALGKNPSEPFVPCFGDVAMVGCVSTLPG